MKNEVLRSQLKTKTVAIILKVYMGDVAVFA